MARLAAEDRIDALQLELSVATRWPGAWRQALLAGLEAGLASYGQVRAGTGEESEEAPVVTVVSRAAGHLGARSGWQVVSRGLPAGEGSEPDAQQAYEGPLNLMAVLSGRGDSLFAGVEPAGRGAVLARVCLVLADGRMALFTSDSSSAASGIDCPGLQVDRKPDDQSTRLRLDAPVVVYPSHLAYLDLEQGMGEAELSNLKLDLRWTPGDDQPEHGRLRGDIELGGKPALGGQGSKLDAFAVLQGRGRDAGREGTRARFFCDRDGAPAVVLGDGQVLMPGQGDPAVVPGTGEVKILDPGSGLERATLVTRVPLWRPLGEGVYLRWSFGVASCRLRGEDRDTTAAYDSAELFTAREIDGGH